MKLFNKFYMADPGDTGGPKGPSDRDKRNAEELEQIFVRMQDTLRSIANILKDSISEEIENLDESSQKVARSLGKELEGELKKSVTQTRILRSNESDIAKGLISSKNLREQTRKIQRQQVEVSSLLNQLSLQQNGLTNAQMELEADIQRELQEQLIIAQGQIKAAEKLEDKTKVLEGLLKGIAKIPILGQFVQADKILEKVKEAAADGGSKMDIFAAGFKAFLGGIAAGLTGLIIPALKFIIDSVIQFNQKAFDLAKNLGTSADQGERLQKAFTNIANNSANAGLIGKDIVKTYTELSNTVGYLVPTTAQFAESAALIQKRIGASAEDMTTLARQSALNGQTLEQTYATLSASRVIEGVRNKLALTNKQILDGIAKTSAAVVINFKGSTEALANAVIRATKLGTTLNDINKQAESLIDFELSIQKEFELQVLTGRDINLTKARELALLGDTAGLMEELNRQQVTYDSFTKENVIQRKAEADAIGLSVEELSKKLLAQKQANALGAQEGQSLQDRYNQLMKTAEGQKRIKEELTAQEQADLRRASMQEKFQAAVERLKDTLGEILAGPVGNMVQAFASFVGDTKRMTALGNTLKGIFDFIGRTIERFPQILSAAIGAMKILASLSVARAVASIVGSLSTIPVVGPAAGIVAGLAAYTWLDGLTKGAGGGAPGITTPTEGGITQPINPYTSYLQPEKAVAESTKTPVVNLNANIQVGTEGWAKQTMLSLQQHHGTTIR